MAEDDLSWWDQIRGTLSGLMPAEKKYPPAFQAEHWEPTLKKAGYAPDSPEALLLGSIGKHINAQPMPDQPSTGQKIGGGLFSALGAGLARGAGASVEGALQPTQQMLARVEDSRIRGEQARTGGWSKTGELVIPQVAGAVSRAQELKRLQEIADQQRERYGYGRIYNTPKAAPEAPGAAPPSGAPALAPGAKPAPAAPGGPGMTPPAPTAAAGPAGQPTGDPDRKFGTGNLRFHTQEWSDWFDRGFRSLTEGVGIAPVVSKDSKGNITATDEIKTPADLERVALEKDRAAHEASLPYLGARDAQTKNVERSHKMLEGLDDAAAGARLSKANRAVFGQALRDMKAAGINPGPGEDWRASIANAVKSLNIPGVSDMFDANRIANIEAMRKASIGDATAMAKSLGPRPTQFEFGTFLKAVPSATLSMAGSEKLQEVLNTFDDVRMQEQELAADLMTKNKGQLPYNIQSKFKTIQAENDAKLKAKLDEFTREYGGAPANDSKPGATAAPALSRDEAIKKAQELQLQNPALSKDEALKQALGAAKQAPATTGAQPAPAAQGAQPQAGQQPAGTAPVGTEQGNWIMSPTGWVEKAAYDPGQWLWKSWKGWGGGAQAKPASRDTAQPRPAPSSAYPGFRKEEEDALRQLNPMSP